VAIPAERQTTTLFGRIYQNATSAVKFAIYDCLVIIVIAAMFQGGYGANVGLYDQFTMIK